MEPIGRLGRLMAVKRAAAVAVAVLGLLGTGASPAGARQQPDPPVEVELEVGFSGYFVPGRPVPIRVRLGAPSLVEGRLVIGPDYGPAEVVDFEVAGGGREEHWVLLDAPMQDVVDIDASLEPLSQRTELASGVARWDAAVHLVGVLDGSALAVQPPDDVRTAVLGQEVVFAPVPPPLLDLGSQALAPLDSVALTDTDLAALPERHREALTGWVLGGGTLYVDVPPGAVDGLPELLQPAEGSARAGAGQVVATAGQLAAGRWDDVLVPAPNRSIHEDRDVAQNLPHPDLGSEVFAADLGRDLPSLARLLGIIGVYALVVGPAAYVVLRRRPMARWAAMPVLAGVATAVLYLGGGGGPAAGTTVDVVDVIETGPSAVATTRLVVAADEAGREVVAPAGWAAEQDEVLGFGAEGRIHQQRTPDGVSLTVPASAGGVGVLRAAGPVELDGALEVTATAAADGVMRGTVRNTTGVPLEEVAVFVGRSTSTSVGDLEPGGSATFEASGTDQFRFVANPIGEHWAEAAPGVPVGPDGGMVATTTTIVDGAVPDGAPVPPMGPVVSEECDEFGNCTQCDANGTCVSSGSGGVIVPELRCDDMGNCFPVGSCGEPGPCGTARPASLLAALWDRGTNAMSSNLVTAVGWTDRLEPVVDLGDDVDVVGIRTALVGRAVPAVDGGELVDSGALRTLVRAGQTPDGSIELVHRFDLPTTVGERPVDPARLRLDIPAMYTDAAFVTPAGEQVVRRDADPAAGRQEVPVPPGGVHRGHVYVRLELPFAAPSPGRELVLYEEVGA